VTDLFPEFRTDSLLLRRFRDEDQAFVFRGLSHPEVIRYYGVRYDTLDATRTQMDWFSTLEENKTGIWWAICSSDDQNFYGACGFNNIQQDHKKAEIGYWLLPEFWAKGIVTEAIPLICWYGFENLGLHRIEAMVETENDLSKRVLEKLNFTFEGTLRDCERKDGRFISLSVFSLLSDELA
jgi:[ribosomal protein S5]-alanine N-acetyltransferase